VLLAERQLEQAVVCEDFTGFRLLKATIGHMLYATISTPNLLFSKR
jgi:hypothetical protein